MRERAVGVEIAVAQRMMGAVAGLAARAGAAGDRRDEQFRRRQLHRQERHARQQCRGGEAARMRHVRRRKLAQLLRQRAGEGRQSRRGAVRMLVHRLVAFRRAIAKVGRDVHHARFFAGSLGFCQQRIDQCGGGAVRGGRENGGRLLALDDGLDLTLRLESLLRIHRGQVAEGRAHRLARPAVGHDAGERQGRMAGDQAQQFAGHIAGTAKHHGGDRAPGFPALAHQSPPAAAWRAWRAMPMASIT